MLNCTTPFCSNLQNQYFLRKTSAFTFDRIQLWVASQMFVCVKFKQLRFSLAIELSVLEELD